MQVIVLGAGAIGSLYGAKLAVAGNDVLLVGRAEHIEAINSRGLEIQGLETEIIRVRASTRVETLEPEALVLVTTKVPATPSAMALVAPSVRDDTTILSLQNGLGSESLVRAAVTNRAVVLRGITQFGAIFERPGIIRYMVAGHTLLEKHARSQRLADCFTAAGLDCRISSHITTEVWRKLIYNCVVNPITAIIGGVVGDIADSRLERVKQLVIDECLAVAAAKRISFDTDFMREIDNTFSGSPNIVSMLQDIRRGRPTEVDYMNGAVSSLGAKHGIPCPVNAALSSIIKALTSRTVTPPKENAPIASD